MTLPEPQRIGAISTFTVHGEPIPQGSTKAFVVGGRARITSDNTRTRPWRAVVNDAAHEAGCSPQPGPIAVDCTFTLKRPKSRPKRDRYPDRKPDSDKLARALLDALTGTCWDDDAQVTDLAVRKRYVGHPDALPEPGAHITVMAVIE